MLFRRILSKSCPAKIIVPIRRRFTGTTLLFAYEMKTEEKWDHSAPPSCCFTTVAVRSPSCVWRAPWSRDTNADRTTQSILARENAARANRPKRASTVSKWNGTTQWARRATTVRTTWPIVTDQTVCRPTALRSPLSSSIEVCRDLPYK